MCSIANVNEMPGENIYSMSDRHVPPKAIGLHSQQATYRNLTISIASFWQAWHSKVRCCEGARPALFA